MCSLAGTLNLALVLMFDFSLGGVIFNSSRALDMIFGTWPCNMTTGELVALLLDVVLSLVSSAVTGD